MKRDRNWRKELSPAQLEERKEVRRLYTVCLGTLLCIASLPIIVTTFGLKIIKWIIGVDSFGLAFGTLLAVHTMLFVAALVGILGILGFLIKTLDAKGSKSY